jgi:hypothetical protein
MAETSIEELIKPAFSVTDEELASLQEGTKRKLPWASQKKSGTILAGHRRGT